VVSEGPNADLSIPYIKRPFKGTSSAPKCPRCGERMSFERDGGSLATWICEEDRLVLSSSHHLLNNLTGFWKIKKWSDNQGAEIIVDGKGWL
jgi:hypothetical protein